MDYLEGEEPKANQEVVFFLVLPPTSGCLHLLCSCFPLFLLPCGLSVLCFFFACLSVDPSRTAKPLFSQSYHSKEK